MIQLEDTISDDWSEGDKEMMRSLAKNGPAVLHDYGPSERTPVRRWCAWATL